MFTNKLFIFLYFFFILFISHIKADEKIVFIDMNLVFNESSFGSEYNKIINNKSNQLKDIINQFQKKIENQKQDLLNKKNILNSEEYNQKMKELDDKIIEYNNIIKIDESDLNNYKVRVKEEFFKNLLPILEDYSNRNSISVIIKKESILIAKNTSDISYEIIKLLNEKNIKLSIK